MRLFGIGKEAATRNRCKRVGRQGRGDESGITESIHFMFAYIEEGEEEGRREALSTTSSFVVYRKLGGEERKLEGREKTREILA